MLYILWMKCFSKSLLPDVRTSSSPRSYLTVHRCRYDATISLHYSGGMCSAEVTFLVPTPAGEKTPDDLTQYFLDAVLQFMVVEVLIYILIAVVWGPVSTIISWCLLRLSRCSGRMMPQIKFALLTYGICSKSTIWDTSFKIFDMICLSINLIYVRYIIHNFSFFDFACPMTWWLSESAYTPFIL